MMLKKFLISVALTVIICIGIVFVGGAAFLRLTSEIEIWTDWSDTWTNRIFLLLLAAAAIAFIKSRIEKRS